METRGARPVGRRAWLRLPVLGVLGGFLAVSLGTTIPAWSGDRPSSGASRRPSASTSKPGSSKPAATVPQVAVIDRAIAEEWEKAAVKPARLATDEEFLRRAYLDLLGRIPNVQEARAFLATREAGKREKLVAYLLNHADYAKNFATQWSVLLIGRGNQGRRVDRPALTTWLRQQLGADRPWNEIVREL